jgi:hypothetical protein
MYFCNLPLALWPIVAVAFFHFGAALHAHHLLPTLLRVYQESRGSACSSSAVRLSRHRP